MTIYFKCPSCQKKYSVTDDHIGEQVNCKRCGSLLTVPEKSEFDVNGNIAENQKTEVGKPIVEKQIVEKQIVEKQIVEKPLETKTSKSIFSSTIKFISLLSIMSFFVAMIVSQSQNIYAIIGTTLALITLSIILAAIPLVIYKLLGKDLKTKEFISIISVAWIIVALLQILGSANR